jgi:hypothetical protein
VLAAAVVEDARRRPQRPNFDAGTQRQQLVHRKGTPTGTKKPPPGAF